MGALTSAGITASGTVAVNASGGVTTDQTTFPLVNTTATTVNFAGAATSLNMGASTGTTTVNNDLNIASGKVFQINSTSVLSGTTLGSGVTGSSLTSVGTLTSLTVSGDVSVANTKGYTLKDSGGTNRYSMYMSSSISPTAGDNLWVGNTLNASVNLFTNNTTRITLTANGGVAFGSSATAYGTSGQLLQSNGDTPPTWVTPTFASTGKAIAMSMVFG
jgi:hypothetical protein